MSQLCKVEFGFQTQFRTSCYLSPTTPHSISSQGSESRQEMTSHQRAVPAFLRLCFLSNSNGDTSDNGATILFLPFLSLVPIQLKQSATPQRQAGSLTHCATAGTASSAFFCQVSFLLFFFSFSLFLSFLFQGPQVQHVEVPRLGVQSELLATATTTAMQDLSCV